MSKSVPLCTRCVKVYGECKYKEQKEQEQFKSPWTCQGRMMACRIAHPIIQELLQTLKDVGLFDWTGPHGESYIAGNAANALLTYLEEHAGAVTHYVPDDKPSQKIGQSFDPKWIFKKKIDWEKNLPLYKNRQLKEEDK